jgi:hypothetical protein
MLPTFLAPALLSLGLATRARLMSKAYVSVVHRMHHWIMQQRARLASFLPRCKLASALSIAV